MTVTTDEARAAEAAIQQFQDVADQLADPRTILANALHRIHQADAVVLAPDEHGDPRVDPEDAAVYQLASAYVLRCIAETAAGLDGRELTVFPAEHGADIAADDDPPPPVKPQAVNGVRFEADLADFGESGWYVMGWVAGTLWLHAPGYGFLDITHAIEIPAADEGRPPRYRLEGRVVSATPGHILGITDDGASVTLPRALVREVPDDRR